MKEAKFIQGRTTGIIIAVIIAIIIAVLLITAGGNEEPIPNGENGNGDVTEEWNTFESEEFGFSLEYPSDWEIATSSEDDITPRIVFYEPPVATNATPPYDHFVNDTFVGIYPEGIPTEGLMGIRGPLTTDMPALDLSEDSLEYKTEDGTPFAWLLRFNPEPESWGESGYVWGRAMVDDLNTVCLQNGEEVEMSACDIPLAEGAEIVQRGEVDDDDWESVMRIIRSITFN